MYMKLNWYKDSTGTACNAAGNYVFDEVSKALHLCKSTTTISAALTKATLSENDVIRSPSGRVSFVFDGSSWSRERMSIVGVEGGGVDCTGRDQDIRSNKSIT